ncbi:MAG: tRNA (adenosine(37)-N6)-threonylcarbamoyltransferase complex dimerization subunit type 1 TsaB [Candidatus Omnitrophota bacterium]|nr:tRNA (adenosine(37)-N6)-threonylcarbamoyltransferase complex dimerization subunit type 1 TsaB [Candidatus Omnitrophota bacterium]
MRILAIDTSTKSFCLGFYDDDRFYAYTLELKSRLSSLITPSIQRVIMAVGLEISDIDFFCCGLGPGSFTGLRIGLATIKGLCWSIKKPVIGISSLEIIALNASKKEGYIVVLLDAKRGLVYCGIYKSKNGLLTRVMQESLLKPQDLFRKINSVAKDNRVSFLGDAVELYRKDIFLNVPAAELLDSGYWYPQPQIMLEAALKQIKKKKFSDIHKIQPLYLYPAHCQVRKN